MTLNEKPLIIAEAGVNHNGDLNCAFQLVQTAAASGVDIVKFQSFKAEKIASRFVEKANYQKLNSPVDESQLKMLKRLELSEQSQKDIAECCKRSGVAFLSSAFDLDSLHFLALGLDQKLVKFGSGELTNAPLLFEAARLDLKIFLSTGMSNLSEVEDALSIIAFGLLKKRKPNSRLEIKEVLQEPEAWELLKNAVTLFHCTSEYPADPININLKSMDTLNAAFNLPVGFSDHSKGSAMALAAVARGAVAVEKHFTLSKQMDGPDHMSSMEPHELAAFVNDVNSIHVGLGNGVKQPNFGEVKNRNVVRKVIVAARDLSRGQSLSFDDLAVKRAGSGISPFHFWSLQGKFLKKSVEADQPLKFSDLK